ncbi:hypothetical protein MTsN2n4_10740 [Pseudoalteromonas sp. MTN2-4]
MLVLILNYHFKKECFDMGIYNTLEYADSNNEVKAIYDDIFEHLGNEGLVDYFKVLGNYNPHILQTTWALFKNVLLTGELPRALKELVFIAISNERDCAYCTSIHCAMCRYLNIDDETINQVLQKSSELKPKRVKVSIDFAVKMATNSAMVTEQDHQSLLDSGLTKNQVFELMSLASVVNYSNTLAQGMMLVVDEEFANLLKDNVVM